MDSRRPQKLLEAINRHAGAVTSGEEEAALDLVGATALDAHRRVLARAAAMPAPRRFELLAVARIGSQYIAKVRVWSGDTRFVMQNRWKEVDAGRWRVVEIEEFAGKRTPWSDLVSPRATAAGGAGA